MRKRVPTFRNDEEAAAFWDTHDSTDYLADLPVDTQIVFVRPEARLIQVSELVWKAILDAARRRRTTPARLVSQLLRQGLPARRSRRRVRKSGASR